MEVMKSQIYAREINYFYANREVTIMNVYGEVIHIKVWDIIAQWYFNEDTGKMVHAVLSGPWVMSMIFSNSGVAKGYQDFNKLSE